MAAPTASSTDCSDSMRCWLASRTAALKALLADLGAQGLPPPTHISGSRGRFSLRNVLRSRAAGIVVLSRLSDGSSDSCRPPWWGATKLVHMNHGLRDFAREPITSVVKPLRTSELWAERVTTLPLML
jgi:hypothetical protein